MSETTQRMKQLDAMAAEQVMGWKCCHDHGDRKRFDQLSDPEVHCIIYHGNTIEEPIQAVRVFDFATEKSNAWSPTTNLADAFDLLPCIMGAWFTLYEERKTGGWRASFCRIGVNLPPIEAVADTVPLAITKAALLAVGD